MLNKNKAQVLTEFRSLRSRVQKERFVSQFRENVNLVEKSFQNMKMIP